MASNLLWHAAAVIGERDLDLVKADAVRPDPHLPAGPIGEGVRDGIEDEIGEDFP